MSAPHFRDRVDLPKKKYHLESGLNQRDRATAGFVRVYTHRKPGKIFYWRGFALLVIYFGHPFPRQDGPPERKCHFESGLNQRDEAAAGFVRQTNPDEAEKKNLDRGCRGSPRRWRDGGGWEGGWRWWCRVMVLLRSPIRAMRSCTPGPC